MKPLKEYLEKDYPVTVYNAPEGGYVVEIEELSGCITEGETLEEAFKRIDDARSAWIEVAYEDGQVIPPPKTEQDFSGKFLVRVTKSLHRKLAELSTREGVSLNQTVQSILSAGVSELSYSNKLDDVKSQLTKLEKAIERKQSYTAVAVPSRNYQWLEPEKPPSLFPMSSRKRGEAFEEVIA